MGITMAQLSRHDNSMLGLLIYKSKKLSPSLPLAYNNLVQDHQEVDKPLGSVRPTWALYTLLKKAYNYDV